MMSIRFVLKRLVFASVLLLTVSFLVFLLQSFSKNSIVSTVLGGRPGTPEQVAAVRAQYHLDDPFMVRFAIWLRDAAQLDFGTSIRTKEPVWTVIADRLPVTLELAGMAIFLVVAIGVPFGMIAGIRRGSTVDRIISIASIVGLSAPVFATGIFLLYIFGVFLGWLPSFGAGGPALGDRLRHLALPSVALVATLVAVVARQTRAATLDVMQQDYVTFARARGLRPSRILTRYALRNVAIPVVTVTGLLTIYLIGGTILVEQVFSIPGLGQLMVSSVELSDVPVVQGIALVIAIFVVLVTLVVDVVAMLIDPRTLYPSEG